jgi:hypothetical protein
MHGTTTGRRADIFYGSVQKRRSKWPAAAGNPAAKSPLSNYFYKHFEEVKVTPISFLHHNSLDLIFWFC